LEQARPREHQYRPLSAEKVIFWCVLGRNGSIGPYWFENIDEHPKNCEHRTIHQSRHWGGSEKDGTTPHCSNASLEYLNSYFRGDKLIFRDADHPWPAHSPDLAPLDYILWGSLNDRVCSNNPQTSDALKNNIRTDIRRIPHETFTQSRISRTPYPPTGEAQNLVPSPRFFCGLSLPKQSFNLTNWMMKH